MTKRDPTTNPGRTYVPIPQVLSTPEPGKYLLGGNTAHVRNLQDYRALLHQLPKATIKDPTISGRRLCGLLLRQEFSKEELATKNVTGSTRDSNSQKIVPIPMLDPVIIEAILEQVQYQFPDSDFLADDGGRSKTISYLNVICKLARRDKHLAKLEIKCN